MGVHQSLGFIAQKWRRTQAHCLGSNPDSAVWDPRSVLDKLRSLSKPQFPHLSNGNENHELIIVRIRWHNNDLTVVKIKWHNASEELTTRSDTRWALNVGYER